MGCGTSKIQTYKQESRTELRGSADGSIGRRTTVCVPGTSVSPSDYTIVGLLGDGALGRVYLCDMSDGVSCALKVMSKADIDARGIAANLEMEREILLKSYGHPFVAQMLATFSTEAFEYMAMEQGEGSLFDALYVAQIPAFRGRQGEAPHMSENDARFYFSELCLGVQHIHNLGYCYRDMKLENCLVDKRGHVRVADFDQSAKLEEMAAGTLKKTLVGTPEYMAPEIIRNLHEDVEMGTGIDVWAMGVLLFELIHGRTPFSRRHPRWGNRDTYTEIVYGEPFEMGKLAVVTKIRKARSAAVQERVSLRKLHIQKSGLCSLLERMLVKEPSERISLEEIYADQWMKEVDWSSIKDRMVQPPYLPDRSAGAQQRTRRRSVTKMLQSDSLARPNWDKHARTSLEGLKPQDILHHVDSRELQQEADDQSAPQDETEATDCDSPATDCELKDPTFKFVSSSNPVIDRQKLLEAHSEDLRTTPMTQTRRLTVMFEDEASDEDVAAARGSDEAENLAQ